MLSEAKTVLATAIAKVVNANPWNNSIRALTDTGSALNLITSATVRRLGLVPEKVSISMKGIKDTNVGDTCGRVTLQLHLPDTDEILTSSFHVVKKIAANLPLFKIDMNHYSEFTTLPLADPNWGVPSEIEALFGVRVLMRILTNKLIKGHDDHAMAQSTRLGWIIYQTQPIELPGPTPYTLVLSPRVTFGPNNELQALLKKFWELEEVPSAIHMSDKNSACEQFFQETHTRDRLGRYIVRIPFNETIQKLGQSKMMAIRQFLSSERKMERNVEFRQQYHKFMSEFESLGHMRRLNQDVESGYYTPHHGVTSSDKFRVVMNASCPTTTGVSLNDCQLVGPKLQMDLANLLIRFCTFEFVLTADIVKMFRQVEIHPDDRKYQKIVWRYSPKKPICTYELIRVAYGQAVAPYLSVRAM